MVLFKWTISSTVDRVYKGVATVTETFENIPRTGKRCVWVSLENRGEMERYDWSDFFAVLAVTCGITSPGNLPTKTMLFWIFYKDSHIYSGMESSLAHLRDYNITF